MTPEQWILSNDTGISSKTIWAVMMDVNISDIRQTCSFDIPHDPSDFGRCFRLLELFPEWRTRLPEVAEQFPKWKPMVEHWPEMEALYREELPTSNAVKLYKLMKKLEEKGMVLDGWAKTSSCGWTRSK